MKVGTFKKEDQSMDGRNIKDIYLQEDIDSIAFNALQHLCKVEFRDDHNRQLDNCVSDS